LTSLASLAHLEKLLASAYQLQKVPARQASVIPRTAEEAARPIPNPKFQPVLSASS